MRRYTTDLTVSDIEAWLEKKIIRNNKPRLFGLPIYGRRNQDTIIIENYSSVAKGTVIPRDGKTELDLVFSYSKLAKIVGGFLTIFLCIFFVLVLTGEGRINGVNNPSWWSRISFLLLSLPLYGLVYVIFINLNRTFREYIERELRLKSRERPDRL